MREREKERQMEAEAITKIALSLRSRELNSAPSHSIIVAYFLLGRGWAGCGQWPGYYIDTAVNVGIELALFLP